MLDWHKKQELYCLLLAKSIPLHLLHEPTQQEELFELRFKQQPFYFRVSNHFNPMGTNYGVASVPRTTLPKAIGLNWHGLMNHFTQWADYMHAELTTPDLWVEAVRSFGSYAAGFEVPFTSTELSKIQAQLRLLGHSFAAAALPEAAKQRLIDFTSEATVKAESLTKKDWQNWIIGGFISAITSLMLNPAQAQEVLKLVKGAFVGLFLH